MTEAKIPPHNIEAEMSVLGSLLIDKDAIIKVAEFLRSEHFYKEAHALIYKAILSLYEKREPADLVTVPDELRKLKVLKDIGGATYLTELVNSVPTSANVDFYAHIIKDHAIRRALISVSSKVGELGFKEEVGVNELLDQAEQALYDVSKDQLKRDFVPIKETLEVTFERLDELHKKKGSVRGVPTGFKTIDNMLSGLQDSNLIIIAARPSIGKCVSGESEVIDPLTGIVTTVKQRYEKKENSLVSLDMKIMKSLRAEASGFLDDGIKPVFLVKTALGREIETTASHPFLTPKGWVSLALLNVGERVGVPRMLPYFGECVIEEEKVSLVAYLISDGCLTGLSPSFTNANEKVVEDFIACAKKLGNIKIAVHKKVGNKASTYVVSNAVSPLNVFCRKFSQRLQFLMRDFNLTQKRLALSCSLSPTTIHGWYHGQNLPDMSSLKLLKNALQVDEQELGLEGFSGSSPKNPVTNLMISFDLMGKNSYNKTIPDAFFRLNKPLIALFLNRLFACDGSAYVKNGSSPVISYTSNSKKLVKQVSHLLLRFGIISRIREKKVRYKKEGRTFTSFEVEVLGSEDVIKFIEEIGILGKEKQIEQVYKLAKGKKKGWTKDTLPIEVWDYIKKIKGDRSWRGVYQKLGLPLSHNIHVSRRNPRRETVLKLAKVFNDTFLENLATSDIFWDRIVSITAASEKRVYDLEVNGFGNFVANDVFVHNSSIMSNFAQFASVRYKVPVGIFSLEMSREQVVDRMISAQGDIDAWRITTGNLEEEDFEKYTIAAGELAEAPIYVDDTPGINIMEMRTKARRLQMEHGIKMLVVDYLQLVRGRNLENRVQEVSEISQALKNLARELKVPVVAASQLSRAVEQRGGDKRPQLSDLRESGSIEQDADVVMFLYRPIDEDRENLKLIISKHRNGPTGEIDLYFKGDRTRFYEADTTNKPSV
ncbi:MAG: replicative DNA helicase [Patescibacteria group bacterium]